MRTALCLSVAFLGLALYPLACTSNDSAMFPPGASQDGGGASKDAPESGTGGGSDCPTATPTRCGNDCVNTAIDSKHCGSCGSPCAATSSCLHSLCIPNGCTTDAECEDGLSCTIDSCAEHRCSHAAGPNQGATACPAGQACVVGQGCVPTKTCQGNAECADTDACTVGEKCDSASALCTWAILDQDADGHAPTACGGDDCDDSRASVFTGAPELCDGLDNNCDGTADNGATCSSAFASCQGGSCVCDVEHVCGQDCIDKNTNTAHCGACFHACPSGVSCTKGQCDCPTGTLCGNQCTDLTTSKNHCGSCFNACPSSSECKGGKCVCSNPLLLCSGQCVNTTNSHDHCGTCNHPCGSLEQCVSAQCKCYGTVCSGQCVDTSTNPLNCGQCGKTCGSTQTCSGGVCTGGGGGSAGTAGSGFHGVTPLPAAGCGQGQVEIFGTCFP